MEGTTVSRDRVLEKLGEGGMGKSTWPTDTRLGHPVAPKFLRRRVRELEKEWRWE